MQVLTKVDYCIISAALHYAEKHPEIHAEMEKDVNRMLCDTIYPLDSNMIEKTNQSLWQNYDLNGAQDRIR